MIPPDDRRVDRAVVESASAAANAADIPTRIASGIGIALIAVPVVVLLGWIARLPVLTRLAPEWPSMKPVTATAFVLTGVALLLSRERTAPERRRIARWCAAIVAMIAIATLADYAFDLGIPFGMFLGHAAPVAGEDLPGRMSGGTAAGFLLLGVGVLLLDSRRRVARWTMEGAAALCALLALLAIEGYVFDVSHLIAFAPYGSMALHTAVLLFAGAAGLVLTRPNRGIAVSITSRFGGGRLARIVVPVAVVAPVVLGWAQFAAVREGLIGPGVGLAFFTTLIGLLVTSAVWLGAAQVNAAEAERNAALAELRVQVARFRELSAIVESSDDAILTKTLDGTVRSWNRAAERFYGYAAEEIVGRPIATIVPSDRMAELDELLAKIRRREHIQHFETVRRRNDGRLVDVSLSFSPVALGDGREPGVAVIARDITQRKRAEREVAASEQRLRDVVNAIPHLVWTSTPDGRWDYVSERWAEMLDVSMAAALGNGWLWHVHPDDKAGAALAWENALLRGEEMRHEYRLRRRGGGWHRFSVYASPLRNADGEIEKWVGASTDVEEVRRTEEQLRESEERLHTVLENLTEGVIVSDLNGELLHWNRAGLEQHGYTSLAEGQRALKTFIDEFQLMEVDGRPLSFDEWPMPRAIRGERFRDLDIRIRKTNGDWERTFSYGGTTVTEPGGRRLAVLTINDVTERRRADERFRLLVEASPSGMVLVDGDGVIRMVNGEAERLFGWRRDELVGQSVESLVVQPPSHDRDSHDRLRALYMHEPGRRAMGIGRDLAARRKDGSEFPVEVGLTPIEMEGGTFVLAIVTDITERQRAARAIQRHQSELERSNKELAQFAYVASHDLQEPLRMVASYTQLFAERYQSRLDERAEKYIGYIVDGARRMQQLVRDLLAYARVESQGRELVPVNVTLTLRAVRHDMAALIRESGAHLEAESLPEVWADPGQLHQLLQNLVGNAIKFRSAKLPVIHIGAARHDTMWEFAVQDNGIGIAPEYAERVFAMFQRLHTRDEYPGSGIGLSIARKIVERHGGRIWVDPAVTEGTTLRFTLYAADAALPAALRRSPRVDLAGNEASDAGRT